MRVLLTGFEAFGADTTNPTALAVARLAAEDDPVPGVDLVTAVLPVVFGEASAALLAAVDAERPDVVVATGMAGGRTAITPERYAHDLDEVVGPDGRVERRSTGGPAAYASTLGVDALVDALRAAGIPAAADSGAGHYACHVSYALLGHLAEHHPGVIGGFVHVPCSHEQVLAEASPRPSLSLETITAALRVVVVDCAGRAPRRDDVRRDASSTSLGRRLPWVDGRR